MKIKIFAVYIYYFSLLTDNAFTDDVLNICEPFHIQQIFPKVGEQAKFYKEVQKWRKSPNVSVFFFIKNGGYRVTSKKKFLSTNSSIEKQETFIPIFHLNQKNHTFHLS